jgi:hypothetical protein
MAKTNSLGFGLACWADTDGASLEYEPLVVMNGAMHGDHGTHPMLMEMGDEVTWRSLSGCVDAGASVCVQLIIFIQIIDGESTLGAGLRTGAAAGEWAGDAGDVAAGLNECAEAAEGARRSRDHC